jgi:hypothetical protein
MDLEFEDKDYEKMVFNVHALNPRTPVLNAFPKLKSFPEMTMKLDKLENNKLLKYIMYMYDINTPLKKIEDVNKRKYVAATLAKFPTNDHGHFQENYERAMGGHNFKFNQKLFRFLRFHRSPEYAFLVSIENSYYNNLSKSMTGDSKAYSAAKEQKNDLRQAQIDFLNDDDSEALAEALYEHIEMTELQISPEEVANYLEDNGGKYNQVDPYKLKNKPIKLTTSID